MATVISQVGTKCNCGQPETLKQYLGETRYLVPKGEYARLWYPNQYYVASWMELRCDGCNNERTDFMVYQWSPDGSRYPIVGAFADENDHYKYSLIKANIMEQMGQFEHVISKELSRHGHDNLIPVFVDLCTQKAILETQISNTNDKRERRDLDYQLRPIRKEIDRLVILSTGREYDPYA